MISFCSLSTSLSALVAKLPGLDASSAPSDPESQVDGEDGEEAASGQLVAAQTPAPAEQWDVKDFLSPGKKHIIISL